METESLFVPVLLTRTTQPPGELSFQKLELNEEPGTW
jgi:hypothetical protein